MSEGLLAASVEQERCLPAPAGMPGEEEEAGRLSHCRPRGGGSGRARFLSSKECQKEAFDGFFIVTHTDTYVHK